MQLATLVNKTAFTKVLVENYTKKLERLYFNKLDS